MSAPVWLFEPVRGDVRVPRARLDRPGAAGVADGPDAGVGPRHGEPDRPERRAAVGQEPVAEDGLAQVAARAVDEDPLGGTVVADVAARAGVQAAALLAGDERPGAIVEELHPSGPRVWLRHSSAAQRVRHPTACA